MDRREAARRGQVQIASGLNVAAGIWLIIAPFGLGYGGVALVNDVVVGFVVAVLAVIRYLEAYRAAWMSWINFALGAWLIVAPFVLGYSGTARALWNDIILGVIVLALAFWSATASSRTA